MYWRQYSTGQADTVSIWYLFLASSYTKIFQTGGSDYCCTGKRMLPCRYHVRWTLPVRTRRGCVNLGNAPVFNSLGPVSHNYGLEDWYMKLVILNNSLMHCVVMSGVLHDDVIKWKYFTRHWPFVRGIHRSPVNYPHKGQWRRALMSSLIGACINGWVNNRGADDLRRHRAHYDVTVMLPRKRLTQQHVALGSVNTKYQANNMSIFNTSF